MNKTVRRRDFVREGGEEAYLQRRQALVQAAAKVFLKKGYRAASVKDIADLVGMDRASLYYYVSGKEELFQEVIREATLDNVRLAESCNAGPGTPAEKLRSFIVALMQSFERHYPYLYVYIQEDMTRVSSDRTRWGREMRALVKQFDAAVIKLVQSGLDDGSFKVGHGSARTLAYGVIGMCTWSHRWFKPAGAESATEIGHTFADMVLQGLIARPASA